MSVGIVSSSPAGDPSEEIRKLFEAIEANAAKFDFTVTINAIADDLATSHEGFFNNQADPNGELWKALAPVTVKRKGHPVILIEHNNMRSSVVNRKHPKHVETISPMSMIWGTSDEKALFHQEGTDRIPQRQFVGWSEAVVESTANKVADSAVDQLLSGIGTP